MQFLEQNAVHHNLSHSGVHLSKNHCRYIQYYFQTIWSGSYFNLYYNTNHAFFDSHPNPKNLTKYSVNQI